VETEHVPQAIVSFTKNTILGYQTADYREYDKDTILFKSSWADQPFRSLIQHGNGNGNCKQQADNMAESSRGLVRL